MPRARPEDDGEITLIVEREGFTVGQRSGKRHAELPRGMSVSLTMEELAADGEETVYLSPQAQVV